MVAVGVIIDDQLESRIYRGDSMPNRENILNFATIGKRLTIRVDKSLMIMIVNVNMLHKILQSSSSFSDRLINEFRININMDQ